MACPDCLPGSSIGNLTLLLLLMHLQLLALRRVTCLNVGALLRMPRVDGWSAMREIRGNATTAKTPIVVLTGHDLKEHLKQSALAEGASSYLMKPCLPEQLAREIAECLQTRQQRA